MKIIVFSGTSEGKKICEFLSEEAIETTVCVATDFGREVMEELPYITIKTGRLTEKEMADYLEEYDLVIDATHPYAVEVTKNIYQASQETNRTYLRLLREDTFENSQQDEHIFTVKSVREAAEFLQKKSTGNIFISTGAKELEEYSIIDDYQERLVVRVLPVEASITKCQQLKLKHTITEVGPFSYEQNYQAFSKSKVSWLVTKSAGKAGGFEEKIQAALALAINVLVIIRPTENVVGHSIEEVKEIIKGLEHDTE